MSDPLAVKTIATDAWSNWRTTKCRECGEYQTHGRRLCQKCGKDALTHLADHLSANEVGPWEVDNVMGEQQIPTYEDCGMEAHLVSFDTLCPGCEISSLRAEVASVQTELTAALNHLMTRNNELLGARIRITKLEAELATARATADSRLTELRQYLEQRNELVAERDAALAEWDSNKIILSCPNCGSIDPVIHLDQSSEFCQNDFHEQNFAIPMTRLRRQISTLERDLQAANQRALLREEQISELITKLSAANQRADDAVAAAQKLVNEASGFLQMADSQVHGVTNMCVLAHHIQQTRDALEKFVTQSTADAGN